MPPEAGFVLSPFVDEDTCGEAGVGGCGGGMVYKNPMAGTAQWCGKVLEPVFRVPDLLLLLPSAPCVTLSKSLNTSVTLFLHLQHCGAGLGPPLSDFHMWQVGPQPLRVPGTICLPQAQKGTNSQVPEESSQEGWLSV